MSLITQYGPLKYEPPYNIVFTSNIIILQLCSKFVNLYSALKQFLSKLFIFIFKSGIIFLY